MSFLAKLASLIAVPILDWLYKITLGWFKTYLEQKRIKDELAAKQKEIEVRDKAVTVKMEAAQTKEDIKSAAENSINNF